MSLVYTVYHDQTRSLKELVMNLLHRRKYVKKKKDAHGAIRDMNLSIAKGERVGIIGRNGAGKSTLLKVISGILKPTSGAVLLSNRVHPLIEISAGFNPEFTGRENIYLNGYMLGFDRQSIKEKEKEIVEFSELGEFIDIPVKYYSSGMSIRLAFTIATSIQPEILVFDEMLSAGDAGFIDKATRRMRELIDKATAVVVVSHDLNMIRAFTSRTIVIDQGQVVFDGPPSEAVEYYLKLVRG